jgi:predicted phosphodiesterase
MRIVVLSDTHAPRFWKRCPSGVAEHLLAAEVILHAGDVCVATVLEELSAYAPASSDLRWCANHLLP